MKIKITKSILLESLRKVQHVTPTKAALPILQNVKIKASEERIDLTATDLDITVRAFANCEVVEKGETTLPARLLVNAVSKLADGMVELNVDEATHKAVITAGSATFRIAGMNPKDFPILPNDDETEVFTMRQKDFKEMLRKTEYASSKDESRRVLTSVLLSLDGNSVVAVATDGRRLARYSTALETTKCKDLQIVLPSKAVIEIQKNLNGEGEVSVAMIKSLIKLDFGAVTIISKVYEDPYPNYNNVIPKDTGVKITLDRQQFIDALDRVSVFTQTDSNSIKVHFANNEVTVASAASETGDSKDVVAIKYDGEAIDACYNPQYLLEPLKAIDEDEVDIYIKDGQTPAVIKIDDSFLYVLMPLRIN